MSNLYKDAPIVKVVMLKGKDGAKSKLSELTNDMTFLTEEQIITLVTNIVESGSVGDIDTGFVTKLVEQNKHKALQFWVGTQAEYNAISEKIANMFYIITDDTFKEDVQSALTNLQNQINEIVTTNYETEISDLQEAVETLNTETTTLGNKITALESLPSRVYVEGDVENFKIRTAGYITNNKSEVHFYIPLPKYLDYSALKFYFGDATITMTLRQGGHYYHGTAESMAVVNPQYLQFQTGSVSFSDEELEGCNAVLVRVTNGNAPFYSTDTAEPQEIANNSTVGIALDIGQAKIVEV